MLGYGVFYGLQLGWRSSGKDGLGCTGVVGLAKVESSWGQGHGRLGAVDCNGVAAVERSSSIEGKRWNLAVLSIVVMLPSAACCFSARGQCFCSLADVAVSLARHRR